MHEIILKGKGMRSDSKVAAMQTQDLFASAPREKQGRGVPL